MPLSRGCSRATFQANLEKLLEEGYAVNNPALKGEALSQSLPEETP